MNRSKVALIAVLAVIIIGILFVNVGFQIVQAERQLSIDRAKAFNLGVVNLVSRRLDNLLVNMENGIRKEASGEDTVKGAKEAVGRITSYYKIIGRVYVLQLNNRTTDSLLLNNILEKYYSANSTFNSIRRYSDAFQDRYESYDIISLPKKDYIVVVGLDLKYALSYIGDELKDIAPPLEAIIAILDYKGAVLVSSEPIEPYKLMEIRELKDAFTFWRIGLYARSMEGNKGESSIKTYTKVFALLIVVIVLGMYFGILAIAREIETVKLQSEFISAVSHDLKTPLTSIKMYAEMLKDGKIKDKKKIKEYINTIHTESDRLTFLIYNVLEYSRGVGKKRFNMSRVDLVAVANASLDILKPYAAQKGFKIILKLPVKPIYVTGDRIALAQACLNLIDNAIKYSGNSRLIEVTVEKTGGIASFSVKDKGIGIPLFQKGRIFDKFYRGSAKEVREAKGIGLGLTIVKQIMDGHGGKVTVESGKEKGSVFTLVFPDV